MNKIILLGRLTRDPEVRYTPTGKVVCQFTLAVDRPFANQEGQREADFIPGVNKLRHAVTVSPKGSARLLKAACKSVAMMARMATNAG